MQSENPKAGGAKPTTSADAPKRKRPRIASHPLDLPAMCDICRKGRSTQKHSRCSKIRQQRKTKEWESYMANLAAKRALGDRRYARLNALPPATVQAIAQVMGTQPSPEQNAQ